MLARTMMCLRSLYAMLEALRGITRVLENKSQYLAVLVILYFT